jgi:hypothetical protein
MTTHIKIENAITNQGNQVPKIIYRSYCFRIFSIFGFFSLFSDYLRLSFSFLNWVD